MDSLAGTDDGVWRLRRTLFAAAIILHLGLSVFVAAMGRSALAPSVFSPEGIGSFAVDGRAHMDLAAGLAGVLAHDGFFAWLAAPAGLHVKIYSLSFAVLGRWLGGSVLAAEPVNLAYYLAILWLVCRLGQEVFGRRAGLLAAIAVAIWPSFLLHTTQVLRDPLFIAAILSLAVAIVLTLTRALSWKGAPLVSGGALAALIILWLVRRDTWPVVYGFVITGSLLLALRILRERQVLSWNLLAAALLLGMAALVPSLVPPMVEPTGATGAAQTPVALAPCPTSAQGPGGDIEGPLQSLLGKADGAARRIGDLRARFVALYPEAGSNIDTDVRICTLADLLSYLPRAAAVGFLAPFPGQWLVSGAQVGLVGRLASGVETLCMYGVEAMALVTIWKERRALPVWWILIAAAGGMVALGLVVINVGALYRMRYVYWMLIIVLGSAGVLSLVRPAKTRRQQGDPELDVSA